METKDLLAYGDAAMALLHKTLTDHPEGFEVTFTTISSFPGVKALFAHLVGADERWYNHAHGLPRGARYEDHAAATVEEIFGDWRLWRGRLKEYYFGLDSARLATPVPVRLAGRDEPVPMTPDQIFYQLVNHQMFHTGQISMALQQASIDPPYFDYVALMF